MNKDQKDILRDRIRELEKNILWDGKTILRCLDQIEDYKKEKALLEALVQDPKDATA